DGGDLDGIGVLVMDLVWAGCWLTTCSGRTRGARSWASLSRSRAASTAIVRRRVRRRQRAHALESPSGLDCEPASENTVERRGPACLTSPASWWSPAACAAALASVALAARLSVSLWISVVGM